MKDVAVFMGIFAMGYLLTMGFLYVVLNLLPRRNEFGARFARKNRVAVIDRTSPAK